MGKRIKRCLQRHRFGQQSLAWHLIIRLIPAVILLALIDTAVSYFLTHQLNTQSHDRVLADTLRVLARQVETVDGELRLVKNFTAQRFEDADPEEWSAFRIRVNGEVLAGDPHLPEPPVNPARMLMLSAAHYDDIIDRMNPLIYEVDYQEHDMRVATISLIYQGNSIDLSMAGTLNARTAFVDEVMAVLVGGQLLLIVLMTFVIVSSVRSGMESVSRLSDELERRDIDDLNPIDLAGVPKELSPLLLQTNEMLQRLSEAVEAQRRFIGHASHQLRTPLSGLKFESELMLSKPLPPALRDRVLRIKEVTDRMIRLGEQLLILARLDAKLRPRDSFERLNLAELVENVGADWIPRAQRAGVTITLQEDVPLIEIEGDPVLLEQLLGNLIDNAIRYKYPDRAGHIELRLQSSPPTLIVEDDGPGISLAHRRQVFEAFYRQEGSKAGGSGLGLAIVREIAHAHGMHWNLESRPEFPGTRFSMVFPGPRIGARLDRRAYGATADLK